jgi:hypothetical protein
MGKFFVSVPFHVVLHCFAHLFSFSRVSFHSNVVPLAFVVGVFTDGGRFYSQLFFFQSVVWFRWEKTRSQLLLFAFE